MRKWILGSRAAALLLAGCASPKTPPPAPVCPELPPPTVISVATPKYDELHELFELPDTPELWAPAPEDAATAKYRAQATPRIPSLDPRALMEREDAVWKKSQRPKEGANTRIFLDAGVPIVVPSCIERRLFARQAARYPIIEHPTEYGAFILRGGGRARIYFSSMDLVGQKIRHEVTDRVRADVKEGGFRLVAHLHNHTFLLDRKVGDRMWTTEDTVNDVGGGLAPSLPDAGLWSSLGEELNMEEGWITNGLNSSRVPRSLFPRLARHED